MNRFYVKHSYGYSADSVESLLAAGADVNLKDNTGVSVFDFLKVSRWQFWHGSKYIPKQRDAIVNLINNALVIQFSNKLLLSDNEKVQIVKEVALATIPPPNELLDIVGDYNYIKIIDINAAILAVHHFARENIDNVEKALVFIEKYHKEKEALDLIQLTNQASNEEDEFVLFPRASLIPIISNEFKEDDQGRKVYPPATSHTQSSLTLD